MIGKIISHYKIIEKLGSGGMGEVYKAEDLKLLRTVALKFLPFQLTRDKDSKTRFVYEAQTASSLQHNNICSIHDIDESADGQLFIVMDCYEGETLKEKINKGQIPIHEAIDIIKQTASGLKQAHDHGIIHRDIKPANLFITKEGVVKILDFGLAKLANRTTITKKGETLGTAAYMSPEQINSGELDERTDIWSLGIVFYEMLTGMLPFSSEYEQAIFYSILNENYTNISLLKPDTPKYLIDIVDKCLIKDKALRLQKAGDILSILKRKEILNSKVKVKRLTYPSRKKLILTFAAIIIIILTSYLIIRVFFPTQIASKKYMLGNLSFHNQANDSVTAQWPLLIQQLFDQMLIGSSDELAIMYHENINGLIKNLPDGSNGYNNVLQNLYQEGVAYVIDGSITKPGKTYRIDINLINTSTSEPILSSSEYAADEAQLYQAVEKLSKRVNDYLYVKVIHSDKELKNWQKKESVNYDALRKFQLAKDQIFHLLPADMYLNEAVELDSSFISPRIWLLPKLIRTNIKEANRQYDKLKTMLPKANPFEQALIYYAGALIKKDLNGQALFLRKALEYSPGDHILLHNLAYVQASLGNYNEALESLQPCLKIKWPYPPMYELAAECYIKTGNIKEAKDILIESMKLPAITEKPFAMLSAVYWKDNDKVNAAKFENLFISRSNEHGAPSDKTYSVLSDCYADLYSYDKALEKINESIKIEPDQSVYKAKRAEILFNQGNYALSKSDCLKAINIKPAAPRAYFIIGKIYDKEGKTGLANENYKIFYSLDSTSCDAMNIKSRLFN